MAKMDWQANPFEEKQLSPKCRSLGYHIKLSSVSYKSLKISHKQGPYRKPLTENTDDSVLFVRKFEEFGMGSPKTDRTSSIIDENQHSQHLDDADDQEASVDEQPQHGDRRVRSDGELSTWFGTRTRLNQLFDAILHDHQTSSEQHTNKSEESQTSSLQDRSERIRESRRCRISRTIVIGKPSDCVSCFRWLGLSDECPEQGLTESPEQDMGHVEGGVGILEPETEHAPDEDTQTDDNKEGNAPRPAHDTEPEGENS